MKSEKKKISPALFVRQVRQELQKVTWPEKRDTFLSISALTPVILSMYAKYNLNSFIPSTGFSLSPNVGVFIVAFCGIAFLTIIFGAGFAIRLFGKK